MSRPHTSAKYSPIALRPRITFGLLGWSLWSTTCNSASSAYRPSSVVASRSSMPRRSASGSNDWPVLVISLVLIWCLPDRRALRTPSTTIPSHRQRTVKAQAEALRQGRNCPDQWHAAYNDGSGAGDPRERGARGAASREEGSAKGQQTDRGAAGLVRGSPRPSPPVPAGM